MMNNVVFPRLKLRISSGMNPLIQKGRFIPKIDWLTVMFFDCSLHDVLNWIELGDCVISFWVLMSSAGDMIRFFKFIYNGVCLETSALNFYGHQMDVLLFDVVVPKIRLELSGSALDYLRSRGINMDDHRLVPPIPEGGSYHFHSL